MISELLNKIFVLQDFLTVSIAVFVLVKVDELNDIKIPFVRIGLHVPSLDVVPFTDVFPMSNLLEQ